MASKWLCRVDPRFPHGETLADCHPRPLAAMEVAEFAFLQSVTRLTCGGCGGDSARATAGIAALTPPRSASRGRTLLQRPPAPTPLLCVMDQRSDYNDYITMVRPLTRTLLALTAAACRPCIPVEQTAKWVTKGLVREAGAGPRRGGRGTAAGGT